MSIILLSSDLMVQSRVAAAATRVNAALQSASDSTQALRACAGESTKMLIVDLTTPKLEIAELVSALRSAQHKAVRIVAFGPHVHEERLATARQAGCDEVISRGQFFAQLDAIFAPCGN